MKKDKYITRWLVAAFLVIFTAILVPMSCKSQLNPTFTSIKTDSVRSRHDTLWITNNSGSISWIRTKGDSLFFGDATGEKSLSIIGTGGGGPGGTFTPGCLDALDKAYVVGYTGPTFLEFDTIPITPKFKKLSITSLNLTSADSLLAIAAPGTGKVIIIDDVVTYYNYNTTTYANGATSYIYTYEADGETAEPLVSVALTLFTQIKDTFSQMDDDTGKGNSYTLTAVGHERGMNQPVWLQIGAGFITGNGTATMIIEYHIADFN